MIDTNIAALKTESQSGLKKQFLADVLRGFGASPKFILSKYFYDKRGGELFEKICVQPEYYPTVTEVKILKDNIHLVASIIGVGAVIVELGSGSAVKTRLLLKGLRNPRAYIPVDISADYLINSVSQLNGEFPDMEIVPVNADFTDRFYLPELSGETENVVVFFSGSTIGNFEMEDAVRILTNTAEVCGSGSGLLIGVDLQKDVEILNSAYNDAEGVTSEFNLNVLSRIKRELSVDLDPFAFVHKAFYNVCENRIEMHLESTVEQTIMIGDKSFRFRKGESIHTENSYKYTVESFRSMAEAAGYRLVDYWTDIDNYYSLQFYRTVR